MKKIKLIVATEEDADLVILERELKDNQLINYLGGYANHEQVINVLKNNQVDLLILDFFINGSNIFDLIKDIKNSDNKINMPKRIVVLTSFTSNYLLSKFSEYEIDFVLLKPLNMNHFNNMLRIFNEDFQKDDFNILDEIEYEVTKLLHDIGIPASIKGFLYLREAIKLTVKNAKILESVTKELYPTVSRMFLTTPSRVERAMRHAIEISFERGNIDLINSIFSYTVSFNKTRPTNSEFIAMLADKIRMDHKLKGVKLIS